MYKIPGRDIVCETFSGWVKEMIWVYVVMKVFRADIEAVSEKPENPPVRA